MSTDRFNQLPEPVREFLHDMRQEDVELLAEGIALVRSVRTVSKFVKWMIVGIIGAVVGTAAFINAVSFLFGKMKGGS